MVSERGVAPSDDAAAARDRAGHRRRPARRALGRGQGAHPGRGGDRQGVLERSARRDDRARSAGRSRRACTARAQGVRAARAALLGGDRDRVRLPPRPRPRRRLWAGPARARADKHLRAAEWIESLGPTARTAPRCSPTTIRARSSSLAQPARTWSRSPTGASRSAEAGDRAYGLSAWGPRRGFYARRSSSGPPAIRSGGTLLFRYGAGGRAARLEPSWCPVLEEARDVLLAYGEREQAAEGRGRARGRVLVHGQSDRAREHLRRAAELIEGAAPSRAKAFVLSQVPGSRCSATRTSGRSRWRGRRWRWWTNSASIEIRAQALNIIGTSRMKLGEREGLKDLERCIEITAAGLATSGCAATSISARRSASSASSRAAPRCTHEGLREAERFGSFRALRWLEAERAVNDFSPAPGRSERAREEFLDEIEARPTRTTWRLVRWPRAAQIRLARGDYDGALEDSERVLALTGVAKDPQVLYPSLALHSRILLEAGRPS